MYKRQYLGWAWPMAILIGAMAAFVALVLSRPSLPATPVSDRVWRVEVQVAQPRRVAPESWLYGRVEAQRLFQAAAPGPTRVAEIRVREGQQVSAGELLAVLDARDFAPVMQSAQAELAEVDAEIQREQIRHDADLAAVEQQRRLRDLAVRAVARARSLRQTGAGSATDLDLALQSAARQELDLNSREQAIAEHPVRKTALMAQREGARARVQEAALAEERSRIIAPCDAVVAAVHVAAGNLVEAHTILLDLYSPDSLEVRARLPAAFQMELQQALAGGDVLPGRAEGSPPIELELVRLAGEARPSDLDGLFRVTAGRAGLRPGQVVSFRLFRPARGGALAVPFEAVHGGQRLYSLAPSGRLRVHRVEILGGVREDGVERLLVRAEGVAAGDQLVVTHLPHAVSGLRAWAVASP